MTRDKSKTNNDKPAVIVAIDDDPTVITLLNHTLDKNNYTIVGYTEPMEGLSWTLKNTPDLVITDLTMPGITGLEIIEKLREKYSRDMLPIIVLSALGDEEVILQCFASGATDYLLKPFSDGELKAKIQILISRIRKAKSLPAELKGSQIFDEDGFWEPDDLIGKIFANYEILEKVGEGGMGVVYRAQNFDSKEIVALKVLAPEFVRDKTFLKRFFREANHLKEVNHVNITQFYELGHENKTYYIAMEYVDGPSIEDYLENKPLLTEVEIVEIIIQVCEALNAINKLGIVHRDIKPGNILINSKNEIKIVDFGLTKKPTDKKITQTNVFFGTATYMSPEQARGSTDVDIRSDLYAVGILFYFLSTGDVPFDDDDTYSVLFKQIHEEPDEPQKKNKNISNSSNFMIQKMLSKDPDNRYQTPAEILRALKELKQELIDYKKK
ncbi:MAG: protein kinase [Planctomycetes bacterium]|nr:protein kinase [Planctomycetota bacterium]